MQYRNQQDLQFNIQVGHAPSSGIYFPHQDAHFLLMDANKDKKKKWRGVSEFDVMNETTIKKELGSEKVEELEKKLGAELKKNDLLDELVKAELAKLASAGVEIDPKELRKPEDRLEALVKQKRTITEVETQPAEKDDYTTVKGVHMARKYQQALESKGLKKIEEYLEFGTKKGTAFLKTWKEKFSCSSLKSNLGAEWSKKRKGNDHSGISRTQRRRVCRVLHKRGREYLFNQVHLADMRERD